VRPLGLRLGQAMFSANFCEWSLAGFSDHLPAGELVLSRRVSDKILARGYLSLRYDYGIGNCLK